MVESCIRMLIVAIMAGSAVLSLWTQDAHWLYAGLTPLIGLLAVWIAFQQAETHRMKVKLELYGRRQAIYSRIRRFIADIQTSGNATNEMQIGFMRDTREARFLLGREIDAYIEELRRQAAELDYLNKRLDPGNPRIPAERRDELADKEMKAFEWFGCQYDRAEQLFAPYLDFEKVL